MIDNRRFAAGGGFYRGRPGSRRRRTGSRRSHRHRPARRPRRRGGRPRWGRRPWLGSGSCASRAQHRVPGETPTNSSGVAKPLGRAGPRPATAAARPVRALRRARPASPADRGPATATSCRPLWQPAHRRHRRPPGGTRPGQAGPGSGGPGFSGPGSGRSRVRRSRARRSRVTWSRVTWSRVTRSGSHRVPGNGSRITRSRSGGPDQRVESAPGAGSQVRRPGKGLIVRIARLPPRPQRRGRCRWKGVAGAPPRPRRWPCSPSTRCGSGPPGRFTGIRAVAATCRC